MTGNSRWTLINHLGIDGRVLEHPHSAISRAVASLARPLARDERVDRCSLFVRWPAAADPMPGVTYIPAVSDTHQVAVTRVQQPDLLYLTGVGESLVYYLPLVEAPISILSLP